ncbi:Uu.00g034210.m01.CDS01 [Anthostomella pinea]|uniref:Uu.00g034210.m01.CDS01 n=1 Tax=Anthostomella pinea TaxID=933095 RepID=A0AAI8YDH1_9PEZI|nr:Uu.00g034210.m01.CDS01 [Anthostomella pinea]
MDTWKIIIITLAAIITILALGALLWLCITLLVFYLVMLNIDVVFTGGPWRLTAPSTRPRRRRVKSQ